MAHYTDKYDVDHIFPDNTPNELWIREKLNIDDLIQTIKDHFGEDAKFSDFSITGEYVLTTYHRYDEPGYTNFLHITRIDPAGAV